MTRQITLQLDEAVLREAERMAAEEDRSVAEWAAEVIAERIRHNAAFKTARTRALARLDRGFDLGGRPLTREQAHER